MSMPGAHTSFRYIGKIRSTRALVVSPHCDDETIGAGGTLCRMTREGVDVRVVFVAPSPNPGDDESVLRVSEGVKACESLGIKDCVHWSYPIRKIDVDQLTVSIADVLSQFDPDVLMLPWYGDDHVDHWRVNEALLNVSKRVDIETLRVLAFEVWTPAPIDSVADVTRDMAAKIKALHQYVSQLALWRYEEMVTALNSFRACNKFPKSFGDVRYAEGFIDQSLDAYLERVKQQQTILANREW